MSRRAVAFLDCSTGVSGDKFLGALLDAGTRSGEFTAEHLREVVAAIAPEARVEVERVRSHGIAALGVHVTAENEPPHRRWANIRALLHAAPLTEPVRAAALRAFEALAIAESSVHGTALDDVHFHEVGAIDSIADVVGTCAGMHALGIERLVVSPIALGSGSVATAHGTLPVPAPATSLLLAGMPVLGGPVPGELTTPTGAALLKSLASEFGQLPPMTVKGTGFGAGTRDIGVPNICQLIIGHPTSPEASAATLQAVVLLETNIDHLPAEELAFAAEELLGGGALDVWQTPIVMKKGRAAITLNVLAEPQAADELTARVVELTGSLGVRRHGIERACAPRATRQVATPWGPARVKIGAGRMRPEHDDVARIAREQSLPYDAVAREIARLAEES